MSQVALYDALAYVASRRPAKRLPTDAQWVRAVSEAQARATLATPTRGSEPADSGESTDAEENEESPSRTAAQFLYLLGGFREWTRSPWERTSGLSQSSSELGFGSQFVTLGGRFDASGSFHMSPRMPQVYESASPRLVFRGVLELPRSIEELARLSG